MSPALFFFYRRVGLEHISKCHFCYTQPMNKIPFVVAILFLAFVLTTQLASAHQPQYVTTETNIQIPDAATSRAYYGELPGKPARYTVTSDTEFSLYVNILSPYLPDAKKDFVVRITNASGTAVASLNVPPVNWERWYEEFAGDLYWKGPEFKETEPAGTYTIEVSNPGNTGKYVLAPGEAETFTLAGTPSTIQQIFLVKTHFFAKPWYSIFEGIIGKVLLGTLIVSVLILSFVVWFLVRRTRKKAS